MGAKQKLNAAHLTGTALVAILIGVIFHSTAIALGAFAFLLVVDYVSGNIRR
ncbi:hypothetical protein KIH39_15510 [Telmatocola sphagniphila]|uniref:Uncharacterized protein n=1 Tax=Telmatocola sphagniphila TaxID=1123043 RepID=A0A8E6B4K2_9BACT|nr:hypothetical protein [Telmatocola sphagniphila]QVL30260.1 hypothetical protein KIH39_15510 [Telmatocola sphagniphila]